MVDNAYYEARQHLNLSPAAYETVRSDACAFVPSGSFARMLNLILSSYLGSAEANIDLAVRRYESKLSAQLPGMPEAVSALAEAYRRELAERVNTYDKGCQFKFQLSRENYDYILSWQDERDHYRGSPGRFIKAVIEEYAGKPFYQREEIVLRPMLELISGCIRNGRAMHITLHSTDGPRRFELIPYRLCADSAKTYHYLVGLSRPLGSTGEAVPAAFRVSRTEKLTPLSSVNAKLSTEQKRLIDSKLRENGVQFLLSESEKVTIRLSPKGRSMLERQLFLRPMFVSRSETEDGFEELVFDCTALQAEFYFFKFGPEAEILAPESLRKSFREKYACAAELYGGNDS